MVLDKAQWRFEQKWCFHLLFHWLKVLFRLLSRGPLCRLSAEFSPGFPCPVKCWSFLCYRNSTQRHWRPPLPGPSLLDSASDREVHFPHSSLLRGVCPWLGDSPLLSQNSPREDNFTSKLCTTASLFSTDRDLSSPRVCFPLRFSDDP